MNLPELIILDVGHGNCSILRNTDGTCVIDTGAVRNDILVHTLKQYCITEISNVFISHADSDHLGGLIELLHEESIRIHRIFINPDATKKSKIWDDVRVALQDARRRSGTKTPKIHGLTTDTDTVIPDSGEASIEILSPDPVMALGSPGGQDQNDRKLTSNSLSAVIRIMHQQHPVALLAADMDNVSLSSIIEEQKDLRADVLVFPHHGGKPGKANVKEFAKKLCEMVRPKLVLFSHSRTKYKTPHPDIVKSIRETLPKTHILCTQLSIHCASEPPQTNLPHLSKIPARGSHNPKKNICCGGSISLQMNGEHTGYETIIKPHKNFLEKQLPHRICR